MILPQFRRTPFSFDQGTEQEKFDYFLKQYLGTNLPRQKAEALDKLSSLLTHPNLIIQSQFLTDDHLLKQDALVIFDAFEAVTNGMYNPSVLEALDLIQPGNLFYGWKEAILSILFFYKDLPEACRQHAHRIPEHSAPARLKKLLLSLSNSIITNLGRNEYQFFQEIYEADPKLSPAVEQILDSLDTGMEDLHFMALEQILNGLPQGYDNLGKALALWSLRQLSMQNFDANSLNEILFQKYGKAEACRLIALGLLGFETETAVLFWQQFLIYSLREGTLDANQFAEGLALLKDFASALHELQTAEQVTDPDFTASFQALMHQIQAAAASVLSFETVLPATFEELVTPGRSAVPAAAPAPSRHPKEKGQQLDLFAS